MLASHACVFIYSIVIPGKVMFIYKGFTGFDLATAARTEINGTFVQAVNDKPYVESDSALHCRKKPTLFW